MELTHQRKAVGRNRVSDMKHTFQNSMVHNYFQRNFMHNGTLDSMKTLHFKGVTQTLDSLKLHGMVHEFKLVSFVA